MSRDVMVLGYLLVVLGLMRAWALGRYRFSAADISPSEALARRVEEASRGAAPELPLVNDASLAHRSSILVLLSLASIGMAAGVWTLASPLFDQTQVPGDVSYVSHLLTRGVMIPLVTLVIAGLVTQLIFTDVDGRGIHRPGWGGREFIPWSSVTEVSIGGMSRATTFLEVRADEKTIRLVLEIFRNPAALIALIRRHVPAERLKGI